MNLMTEQLFFRTSNETVCSIHDLDIKGTVSVYSRQEVAKNNTCISGKQKPYKIYALAVPRGLQRANNDV